MNPQGPVDQGTSATSRTRKILLVEDDRSIRDAVSPLLEDQGYAVSIAENGREALDALRRGETPDLIILDLRMPVMDGWRFRAEQKRDPSLAGIPVLAVSADGTAKAAAIDAAAYLRKPLSAESLLSAIGRILAESDRERLLGKLEEAERFAALGRLAASVGHEINNPLAYVSMNVDLAIGELARVLGGRAGEAPFDELEALPGMLEDCRTGLDRIRDVVKDLQRLSRRDQVKRAQFSLNELLDESLAMARNYVQHRANVRKQYGDLPPVVGDRSAIGQVLLNLIINAVQSLPEGRAAANQIILTTGITAGEVTVEVADTGAGIPSNVLPHIFDPFFTTKPIGEGTGLGLAVSCRIVADHGGRIDVESEVGRGSSFRIVLPMAQPAIEQPPPRVAPLMPEQTPIRGRVLVIDDLPAIGRGVAVALPEHEVVVVARASDAFALFAVDETFDVILCDVLMPELGGQDVVERVQRDWPHLAGRIVLMTGGAFTSESRAFLSTSSQPVLTKPFTLEELKTAVEDQLRQRVHERN